MNKKRFQLEDVCYPRISFRLRKSVIKDIQGLLAKLHETCEKGLHLGAGNSRIEGLINCDLFNSNADMKMDATDLSLFDNQSIDLIESHHMIEHLSFEETDKALIEWNRVLCGGGLLVITFPDITRICMRWLILTVLYPISFREDKLDYTLKMLVGPQEHEGMFHKSHYDKRRMQRILIKHGFKVEFMYTPYPNRPTPSMLVIARKV